MSYNITLPNIQAVDTAAKAEQMQRYLFQMVEQLNYALNILDTQAMATEQKIVNLPSDLEIPDAQTPEATFESIKDLIIKSADIITAYEEEMSKTFDGQYVAISDFGVYKEETNQRITVNSNNTTQLFENQQQITTNVTNLGNSLSTFQETTSQNFTDTKATTDALTSNQEQLGNDVSGIKNDVASKVGNDDFSDYKVETDKRITEGNKATDQLRANQKEIANEVQGVQGNVNRVETNLNSKIDDLQLFLVDISAYIRTGKLYEENGIAIYGVEVGQTNTVNGQKVFSQYARFTANKLSFYDQNGREVAYVSDYKIYITNAEILNSITFGNYQCDLTDGMAFKWVEKE